MAANNYMATLPIHIIHKNTQIIVTFTGATQYIADVPTYLHRNVCDVP